MIGQFAWLTAGRILGAILQAGTFGLLAVLAGPEQLGVVGAVVGILVVLQAACDLGVSSLIVRTRAVEPQDPRIGTAVRVNRWTTPVLIGLGLLALMPAAASHEMPTFGELAPLAVWIAAERNADTIMGVAVADGRASVSVGNLLARRVIALALFVLLAQIGAAPVLAYSGALAVGGLASMVWANLLIGPRIPRPGPAMMTVVREAQPFWWNSVAVQLRNLDATVVSVVAGPGAAGFYSLASRLTVPLRMVPTALAGALLPHAARETEPLARRRTLRSVGVVVGGMSAVYLVLALLMPTLINLVGPLQEFEGAVDPIRILLLALPFAAVASVLTALLQAAGEAAYVARAAMVMSALCLIGAGAGAALAGALGAACGFAVALVAQAVLLSVRYARSHAPWRGRIDKVEAR